MHSLYVQMAHGAPRYVYTGCTSCNSLMGTSLCSIKNRGCCHYFPEFTLVDIQRMSISIEGMQVLQTILNHPGTVVYPYHLHVKGFFDKQGYEEFVKKGKSLGEGRIQDQTVFFRVCPFVKPGYGCTLPEGFRTYVCDLFICSEVLENPSFQEELKPYLEERARYVRWLEWEIKTLRHILEEEHASLVQDPDKVLEILRQTPVNHYDFPDLKPVHFTGNDNCKGA